MNGKKITNLSPAKDFTDALNLQQLIDIYHPYVYELNNFQLYKFINKINPTNVFIRDDLPPSSLIRKHNHNIVYISSFVPNSPDGLDGIQSISHTLRNQNLDPGDYTLIFEIFTELSGKPFNFNKNNVNIGYLYFSNGLTLTKNDHKYVDNEYNKVVLQFDSNGVSDGTIFFRFIKNDNQTPDTLIFFVRLVSGTIDVDYNHNILDDDGRSTVFLANVDMNFKKIDNLAAPTDDSDATNKKYVDDLEKDLLKLDGTRAMTGNLRAATPKYHLHLCKIEKSKILKLCHNKGFRYLITEM